MNKSFKMVTLLGMIAKEQFPGSIKIEDLVPQATRIASRIRILQDEFGSSLQNAASMQGLLESNPIAAWVGGKGMNDKQYFSYDDGVFSSFEIDDSMAEPLRDLTRELCDYRLAQYLDRLLERAKALVKLSAKLVTLLVSQLSSCLIERKTPKFLTVGRQ